MAYRSDARLLVLHALRLKGVATVDSVAGAVGLDADDVVRQVDQLATLGLVVLRDGLLKGWQLTPAGRIEHERLLATELEAAEARPTVERGYMRFRSLNPGVLEACSRWQVRELGGGRIVRNDHADPRYDGKVLGELSTALSEARPLGDRLAEALDRFSPYGPLLEDALDRALAGEREYVTKPLIPSFHTVWFEMHEDLLVTLGLDRTSEAQA
jgi:hypothetical protein